MGFGGVWGFGAARVAGVLLFDFARVCFIVWCVWWAGPCLGRPVVCDVYEDESLELKQWARSFRPCGCEASESQTKLTDVPAHF